jgi:hypothetical protein
MLHSMGVRISRPRRHASHEGGSIDLRTWPRHSHVPNELVRDATRCCAGLTWVMGHSRSHRMARRSTWVLLHPTRMRRKAWRQTRHHLQDCRLSTEWISTRSPPSYRMRSEPGGRRRAEDGPLVRRAKATRRLLKTDFWRDRMILNNLPCMRKPLRGRRSRESDCDCDCDCDSVDCRVASWSRWCLDSLVAGGARLS